LRALSRLVICISALLISNPSVAIAAGTKSLAPNEARLTEAHGDVHKRAFSDWTRESMSEPSPAAIGEVLHEGMQIGTGDRSWAQLSWRHLSARAWANSIYSIAPNQRLVYLVGGEMLYQLDKNRKDKSAYYVWTNLLQARIRGTTVLFQATKETSRITVLEGTVEVLNKVDRSVVTLSPGVVYEISLKPKDRNSVTEGIPSSPLPQAQTTELTRITSSTSQMWSVFDTSKSHSTISAIDPTAIMNHPLLQDLGAPLPSLPLVRVAINNVQSLLEAGTGPLSDIIASLLHDSFIIQSAPKALAYTVNSNIGQIATLTPGVFEYFHPEGPIGGRPGTDLLSNTASGMPLPPLAGTSLTQSLSGVGSSISGQSAFTSNFSTMTSGISGSRIQTGALSGAAPSVSGSAAGTVAGAGGVVSGLGGVVGGLGGTVGGVGGAVGGTAGGLLGGLGGAIGGLGGTVGGLAGSLFGH